MSDKFENYEEPSISEVTGEEVTSEDSNVELTVTYNQGIETRQETKTITHTIKYVDATDETKEIAPAVTQTATLTRTNKRNKVTKVVTEGTWSTAKWEEQNSPTIPNYEKPNIEKVGTAVVTSTSKNTEILVKYPQATKNVTEEKTITRTIKYLEKGTNKVLKKEVQQKATLIRINTVNKVTKVVTNGKWSKGSWKAVKSETIENYKDPTSAVVEKVEVNSTTEDGVINVYYEPKVTPPSIPELEPKSNLVPKRVPNPEPSPAPELKLTLTPIKKIVVDENQQKNKLANTGLESDSIRIYGLMLLGVSLVMIKQSKYIK